MKPIEQIIEELRQPGIPRTAVVHLRYSNGVAQQERVTTLTLRDLQALAAFVEGPLLVAPPPTRSDDHRESDRHPPRPL